MGIAAGCILEINSAATASNVNSGLFNPNNANMIADFTTDTNTANTNSPVVSSATYTFVAGDVGHWFFVKSGTNWTSGWYPIASVTGGKATLSAAVGAASQIVANLYTTNTVAGCATVGTPTNGVGTIDYTRSTAAAFARTDLVIATTTTLTSAAIPFSKIEVGNHIHVTAGTGFTVGWYEIVSVTGVTATVDRVCGTLASTGGTGKVGGALSLGSSDDAVFELMLGGATVFPRMFIKGGTAITYTIGGTVSTASGSAGNAQSPVICESYVTNRGDRPKGATRPTLAQGSATFTTAARWHFYGIKFTSSGTNTLALGTADVNLINCKVANTGTSAGQNAIGTGGGSFISRTELISYRGDCVEFTNAANVIEYCWLHDSNRGIVTANAHFTAIGNIFSGMVTACVVYTGAADPTPYICSNTFHGAGNKLGIGIDLATGQTGGVNIANNIFNGLTTALNSAQANTRFKVSNNNFYNNTNDVNDVLNIQKQDGCIALDPQFVSVSQLTGATATTSGSVLTQSGGDFSTVTDNESYLYLKSGTGVTAGIYKITGHTSDTVTLDIAPGTNATADKIWQITVGNNFAVGTNMKAVGLPYTFGETATIAYVDIGAVQRQEAGGASVYPIFNNPIIRGI